MKVVRPPFLILSYLARTLLVSLLMHFTLSKSMLFFSIAQASLYIYIYIAWLTTCFAYILKSFYFFIVLSGLWCVCFFLISFWTSASYHQLSLACNWYHFDYPRISFHTLLVRRDIFHITLLYSFMDQFLIYNNYFLLNNSLFKFHIYYQTYL